MNVVRTVDATTYHIAFEGGADCLIRPPQCPDARRNWRGQEPVLTIRPQSIIADALRLDIPVITADTRLQDDGVTVIG